jgi:hypothetical protein
MKRDDDDDADDATAAEQPDAIERVIRSHLVQLMEHFDSVSIVVTSYDPKRKYTHGRYLGQGNYHARFGALFAWVEGQRALMSQCSGDDEDDEDDGGDGSDDNDSLTEENHAD